MNIHEICAAIQTEDDWTNTVARMPAARPAIGEDTEAKTLSTNPAPRGADAGFERLDANKEEEQKADGQAEPDQGFG